MEIKGKIKLIEETQSFGSNGFQKRGIVITTEEQYPQHIMVEFVQDKCSLLDNLSVNQDVTVSINLRGREWTSPQGEVKYFNTIQGWRIEAVPLSQPEPHNEPTNQPQQQNNLEEDHDDLPF